MHRRIFMGVGAWLIGVGVATGCSLLAVSLLGQGIAASTSQQLTAAAVSRALASESAGAAQPTADLTFPPPSTTRPPKTRAPATHPLQTTATPSATRADPRPAPTQDTRPADGAGTAPTPSAPAPFAPTPPAPTPFAPTPPAPTSPAPTPAILTSQGGTVVADCRQGGAYLESWSPAQGYQVGTFTGAVVRGPAATAKVTFVSIAHWVTMAVSCSTGVPIAMTTVGSHDE